MAVVIFPQPPYTVISGSKKLVPALGIASAHHVPSCPIYSCGFLHSSQCHGTFPVIGYDRLSYIACSRRFPRGAGSWLKEILYVVIATA